MKILIIATGFAPYSFSENIVNSKLVLAMIDKGWKVDVISRKEEGNTYSSSWDNEWKDLKNLTYEITYKDKGKLDRIFDTLKSIYSMSIPLDGVRWAKRAYEKAIELHSKNHYDIVMSRSLSDISHLAAYKFSKKVGIKWIANWNDPPSHIGPEPYAIKLPFWKKNLYQYLMDKTMKNTDMNTFPSFEQKEYISKFTKYLNNKNTEIIPHIGFLNLDVSNKKVSKKFTLCHAGNLSAERNPEILFKALSNFINRYNEIDFQLDFIGKKSQELEILVKKYFLEKVVFFIGPLSYVEALEQISYYDTLIIVEANLKEAFFLPSKITDYSQLGIPILAITPNNSCISKLINKFEAGITADCNSVDAIENSINMLYEKWNDDTLSDFDSSKLYHNFEPKNIINKYEKIFKYLIKGIN